MKIKVLLVYIVYPLAMATYFRKALQHREDVDLKVAGPYTGIWMPWLGGMTVPPKYAVSPDIPLDFLPTIGEINYDSIKSRLGDWIPDLIIQVDAGLHFKYKPVDGMTVTVGTDPHVLNDWYETPRKYSDRFFNMQKVYARGGDIYLPYAYSTYDHFPTDGTIGTQPTDKEWKNPPESVEYVKKDVDAVLIGMPYPQRVQWIGELRNRGVNVIFENGPIFDEARTLYNRGRIGLNWSSMQDLNARAFELPAMKLYPVMNRVRDMMEFPAIYNSCGIFENNLEDAIAKVMWAVENPDHAQRDAERAYNAVQGQTYDARVEQILKECKFL